jgi:hypothetical protein
MLKCLNGSRILARFVEKFRQRNRRILMKIFLSSCLGSAIASAYCAEFDRLAKLCRTENLRLVSAPEIADLILVVDIYEEALYAGLRQNRIWQKWPAKSFAYCEIDSPPSLGRFRDLA